MILSVAILNLPNIALNIHRARLRGGYIVKKLLPNCEVLLWATLLVLAQLADAILTSYGLSSYGNEVEGNLLIRHLADTYGQFAALVLTKSVAILLVTFLALAAKKVAWVKSTLIILNCVYCFFAILPWSYLLLA